MSSSQASWVSPRIPVNSIGLLIGKKGASIRAFQDAFPQVSIMFNRDANVFNLRTRRYNSSIANAQLAKCKAIITALLSSMNTVFPIKLEHILVDTKAESALVWVSVPNDMTLYAGHFDVQPPLYMLGRASGNTDQDDMIQLLQSLDLNTKSRFATQALHSSDGPHLDSKRAVDIITESHSKVMAYFKDMPPPKFGLYVFVGYHLYGKAKIHGELSTVLRQERSFSVDAFKEAMDSSLVRSSFLNVFPPDLKPRVEKAMRSVFGLAPVQSNHEKVSINLVVMNDDVPSAYQAHTPFKATLLYDQVTGRFSMTPKGLSVRHHSINKITYVHLGPPGEFPLSSRITHSFVDPSVIQEEAADKANAVVNALVEYINLNLDEFHDIGVISESGAMRAVPASIVDQVSVLSIRHKVVTKARKTPIDMTVKHVTLLVDFNRHKLDAGSRGRDTPHLTGTLVSLKNTQFHDQLLGVLSSDDRVGVIDKQVSVILHILNGITKHLASMIKVSDAENEE